MGDEHPFIVLLPLQINMEPKRWIYFPKDGSVVFGSSLPFLVASGRPFLVASERQTERKIEHLGDVGRKKSPGRQRFQMGVWSSAMLLGRKP